MRKEIINSDTIESVSVHQGNIVNEEIVSWQKVESIRTILQSLLFWKKKQEPQFAFKTRFDYISKEDFLMGVSFNGGWRHSSDFIVDDNNVVYWKPEVTIRYVSGTKNTKTFNSLIEANKYAKIFLNKIENKIEL